MTRTSVILGVDPGTRLLGWGLVYREASRVSHIGHGVVKTTSGPLALRLCEIHAAMREVLSAYRPSEAAVETLFFAKDAQAAAKLGHARGVVLLCLAQAGVSIYEYPPASVKRAVTGSGRADKAQVARMVRSLLALRTVPEADAADALAVAISHAYTAHLRGAVERAEARSHR